MRLQYDLLAAHAAPAARMPFARLHKVDRALVFRTPGAFHYAVSRFIHLYEAAWRQNRIHGEILCTDVSVSEICRRELCQIRNRHKSPLLDHAPEIGCAPLI